MLATTVTVEVEAADRLTVKLAVPPSVTVTLLIERLGWTVSLSRMVPTPWASLIVPGLGLDRLTLKVSVTRRGEGGGGKGGRGGR